MSDEKPKLTVEQAVMRFRLVVLGVMSFPIFGMIAAFILIYIRQPPYVGLMLGAIAFITAAYILVVFFFMKQVDALARKPRKDSPPA